MIETEDKLTYTEYVSSLTCEEAYATATNDVKGFHT